MSQESWGPKWTATVGAQVRMLREPAGFGSVQKLADRCAVLGFPIPRSTIANMENGQRPNVTVQEVAVLAAALGVPPVRLLYPIREGATAIEVLPTIEQLPFDALEWFVGLNGLTEELPSNTDDLDLVREEGRLARDVVGWMAQRAQAVDTVERAAAGLPSSGPAATQDDVDRLRARVAAARDALREHREKMRARGVVPAGDVDA
ncbi:XRE family transcriptional regulator [Xylanimonas allomyrinae]|uniref:XRE family transcriptional regulator n=1 Tax=Xylanimonas allomyrinae TaxID=2509459 RepID=A0A4P6EMX8_9MICO|nr:helix-turn-helix transcriptional regulator [Xylanimonas allomyrinae]QAY63726.1 XRE family transcriptional regulator [Xylanimonas allomyrinae]